MNLEGNPVMPTMIHNIILCASEGNDVAAAFEARGYKVRVSPHISEILVRVSRGSGVILCADGFPAADFRITAEMLEIAREKNLRLLIEYPRSVAGLSIGDPVRISHERLISISGFTGLA